ncbi:MAG: iron-sulfur cluster repair di-iron protein [Gemmatimonadetes bacterium]|nr:iron-sulfur cluster repair di-iron protein [Gemmatimonadota bacterium]
MNELEIQTVGQMVVERPQRSRVFDRLHIDYCCGGKRTLEEACAKRGLDLKAVLAELEAFDAEAETQPDAVRPANLTMTELADDIERTHHAYLREELPRLAGLVKKVSAVHGQAHPWLTGLTSVYAELVAELEPHMLKEEQILFPMIRELDQAATAPSFHCGSVGNPIKMMEMEHQNAGAALDRIREMTTDYEIPEGACNSFRAMLSGLEHLEADLHLHIHKENEILFPKASEMEVRRRPFLRS